jgi:hypothetical protein
MPSSIAAAAVNRPNVFDVLMVHSPWRTPFLIGSTSRKESLGGSNGSGGEPASPVPIDERLFS